MKNSERIILLLLSYNSRVITKTKLVKLLFLFAKEEGDKTYSYLPYKYGPFSFQLYRNLSSLARNSWIDEDLLQLNSSRREEALDEIRSLPKSLRDRLMDIYIAYGRLSEKELLKVVYKKYPEFTFRSELEFNTISAPQAPLSIYTIGYEGSSIDSFLNFLLQKGIKKLIDVRNNPVSRKWGFAKNTLAGLSNKVDIEYVHIPELGIPSNKRAKIATEEDYKNLLDEYEKIYLQSCKSLVKNTLSLIEQSPSALLCMEADIQMCHRGRLANTMGKISKLPVVHLTGR